MNVIWCALLSVACAPFIVYMDAVCVRWCVVNPSVNPSVTLFRRALLDWLAPAATVLGCGTAAAAMVKATPPRHAPLGGLTGRGVAPPTPISVDMACRVAQRILTLVHTLHGLLQVDGNRHVVASVPMVFWYFIHVHILF